MKLETYRKLQFVNKMLNQYHDSLTSKIKKLESEGCQDNLISILKEERGYTGLAGSIVTRAFVEAEGLFVEDK